MTDQDLEKTASHWDSEPWNTEEIVFWSQLPSVKRRLALKESGRVDGNWIDYTLIKYFSGCLPLNRCLSLGCGRGYVERLWAERQAFKTCDAYDISPASIAEAQDKASKEGFNNIHYTVSDVDQIDLPAQYYDAAWAVASAHHFSNLENVFTQVAQALKPKGIFILYEYVGANRFQFNDRQRQIIEACLTLLPEKYRLLPAAKTVTSFSSLTTTSADRLNYRWIIRRMADKIREGTFFTTAGRYWRKRQAVRTGNRPLKETAVPTLRSVLSIDPSEAVRSAEIIPLLKTQFDIVEYRPLGGSILQFLLANIAMNFQDEAGEKLLEIFFQLEDTLMECGDLESDFAYIVARPHLNDSEI